MTLCAYVIVIAGAQRERSNPVSGQNINTNGLWYNSLWIAVRFPPRNDGETKWFSYGSMT